MQSVIERINNVVARMYVGSREPIPVSSIAASDPGPFGWAVLDCGHLRADEHFSGRRRSYLCLDCGTEDDDGRPATG